VTINKQQADRLPGSPGCRKTTEQDRTVTSEDEGKPAVRQALGDEGFNSLHHRRDGAGRDEGRRWVTRGAGVIELDVASIVGLGACDSDRLHEPSLT